MILKGKKIILRPVKMSDAPRFVKWFNDPIVNKFLAKRSMTLKAEKKWIFERLKGLSKDIFFCIETQEGHLIGNAAIRLPDQKVHSHVGSLGIMIGEKDCWNQGFGTEAAELIINYGFKKIGLKRIELDVYDYNPRAMKVYHRLGFKDEGTKREHVIYGHKLYDVHHMGILKREWKGNK
jgi:RimJ/RimL family protein N-acetyltransferase